MDSSTQTTATTHRKLSSANGELWTSAVVLIRIWILCVKGNTYSALCKLNGQPSKLSYGSQDRDNKTITIDGNSITD